MEKWYLITSESALVVPTEVTMVSESVTLVSESYLMISESLVTQSFYTSSVDSYYSSSELVIDSNLSASGIIWNLDKSKVWFSTAVEYTGSYIETFDDYDSVQLWIYNTSSLEQQNWDSIDENPEDDPYGIDGPFPEEMDETIV